MTLDLEELQRMGRRANAQFERLEFYVAEAERFKAANDPWGAVRMYRRYQEAACHAVKLSEAACHAAQQLRKTR
jgi:hypothetical protein